MFGVRYGFFLGAGASVDSGIPAAKTLSEKWLRTIKNNKGANNRELKKWEEEPAKYYINSLGKPWDCILSG
jgi:NAD-dependent SIR2 family protein deacetylase